MVEVLQFFLHSAKVYDTPTDVIQPSVFRACEYLECSYKTPKLNENSDGLGTLTMATFVTITTMKKLLNEADMLQY